MIVAVGSVVMVIVDSVVLRHKVNNELERN